MERRTGGEIYSKNPFTKTLIMELCEHPWDGKSDQKLPSRFINFADSDKLSSFSFEKCKDKPSI